MVMTMINKDFCNNVYTETFIFVVTCLNIGVKYFFNVEEQDYIVVQSLVINIGTCFASSYNVFRADDLSYGNVFRERSSRKTLP